MGTTTKWIRRVDGGWVLANLAPMEKAARHRWTRLGMTVMRVHAPVRPVMCHQSVLLGSKRHSRSGSNCCTVHLGSTDRDVVGGEDADDDGWGDCCPEDASSVNMVFLPCLFLTITICQLYTPVSTRFTSSECLQMIGSKMGQRRSAQWLHFRPSSRRQHRCCHRSSKTRCCHRNSGADLLKTRCCHRNSGKLRTSRM